MIEIANPTIDADLIFGALALTLLLIGASAWWVGEHPERIGILVAGVRNQLWLRRSASRYRKQIEFLVRRFERGGAFGLSFTIGLAILIVSVWIFGGVLEDVLAHEEIALFDAPIVSYIASHRLNWLTRVMEGITYMGGAGFLIVVVVLGGSTLRYRTGSWRPFLLLVASSLGAVILDLATKLAIGRPRPPGAWMAVVAPGWAFPSGHSAESTAVYGGLAYLISQTQGYWRAKVSSLACAVLITFLTGVSRVYLGVHWPTDVMAGWALGFAWLAIVFTTASIIERSS